ncbi:MAG TPA: PrsW family glutamic-type intramembrane protease [Terriglobales bacterium]|nr:PrsW family glutamic-type intramembrane protease [Terriglobales bacterium]
MAAPMSPRSARPGPAAARPPAAPAPAWRSYLGDILWAARVIAGAVILVAGRSWPTYWHQLSFLIILALLTYPVRSVRWGTIYNFFLAGSLFAWVIVGVQYVIERVIFGGHLPLVGSVLVAPVSEEIGKVLPLLLLVLAGWRGFRISYGACDLMLCGAALGSGFGLLEDAFRGAHSYPTPSGPALFGLALFPDSYGGFLGHGAATAFVALALGFLMYAWRWRRWLVPALAAALLALFWMMVDHAFANFATFGFNQPWLAPVRWMWQLDGNGRLSPYVLLALILLTLAAERLLLWRTLRGFRRLPASAWFAYWKRPWQRGWGYPQLRATVRRVWAFLQYVLCYRRLAFLMLHWKGDAPPDRTAFAPLIARYTGKVVVAQMAARQS